MKYKAVIFDLDGTLLDTLEDLCDSVNNSLRAFGMQERSLDEIRCFVGNGAASLIARSVCEGTGEDIFNGCFKYYQADYSKNSTNKTKPYDGILPLLSTLRSDGVKIAVVSNKPDAAVKSLCERYFGSDIAFAAGESAHVAKKPAPDSVFTAMRALGVEPDETVYIGDSEVDVATGKNAGVATIAVDWGFRSRKELHDAGAETIASSPCELLEMLK